MSTIIVMENVSKRWLTSSSNNGSSGGEAACISHLYEEEWNSCIKNTKDRIKTKAIAGPSSNKQCSAKNPTPKTQEIHN